MVDIGGSGVVLSHVLYTSVHIIRTYYRVSSRGATQEQQSIKNLRRAVQFLMYAGCI